MVGWSFAFCSHIVAKGVSMYGKFVLSIWMCANPLCFRRYSVLVVGECKHASLSSSGRSWAPPFFAKIWSVRPLYIIPSLHGSLRALRSCLPMQVR